MDDGDRESDEHHHVEGEEQPGEELLPGLAQRFDVELRSWPQRGQRRGKRGIQDVRSGHGCLQLELLEFDR